MPELPEVETSKRDLELFFSGAPVSGIKFHEKRIRVGDPSPDLPGPGWLGAGIDRHGKTLIMGFSRPETHISPGENAPARPILFLLSRFGMSGSWRRIDSRANPPHSHLEIRFSDRNSRLVWVDPRRFGRIELARDPRTAHLLSQVGPDALAISPEELGALLSCTSRPLRAALMDQRLLAGIGNIYMAEVLFAARLSPFRKSSSLIPSEVRALWTSLQAVLQAAIAEGGSTIHSFSREDGRAGGYQRLHLVYGREGLPCAGCGLPVQRTTLEARSLYYCFSCQPGGRTDFRRMPSEDFLDGERPDADRIDSVPQSAHDRKGNKDARSFPFSDTSRRDPVAR